MITNGHTSNKHWSSYTLKMALWKQIPRLIGNRKKLYQNIVHFGLFHNFQIIGNTHSISWWETQAKADDEIRTVKELKNYTTTTIKINQYLERVWGDSPSEKLETCFVTKRLSGRSGRYLGDSEQPQEVCHLEQCINDYLLSSWGRDWVYLQWYRGIGATNDSENGTRIVELIPRFFT